VILRNIKLKRLKEYIKENNMDKDIYTKLEKLSEYAEYDGTEWGETVTALYDMYRMRPYLSDEFTSALEKEIDDQYQYAIENASLEVSEETKTITTKTIDLVWK
jgi:hypothetical protein